MNHAQEQSSHTSAGHSSCGTRGAPKARRPGGPRPAGGRGPRRGPQPVRPSGTKGSPVALLFLLLHIPKPRKCPFLAAGVLAVRRNHTGKSGKTVAYPRAALELWRRGARCCRQMGAVEDSMKDWPPWGDPRQMRPGVPPGNAPPAQRERDKPGGGEPQGPQGRRGGCAAAPSRPWFLSRRRWRAPPHHAGGAAPVTSRAARGPAPSSSSPFCKGAPRY